MIVASADIQSSSHELAKKQGAAAYLDKPFVPDKVIQVVNHTLAKGGGMTLTEQQNDALAELINIGFGRTAASLSDLTGHRILLDAPQVAIYPINELAAKLTAFVPGEVASSIRSSAARLQATPSCSWIMKGAVLLSYLLMDEQAKTQRLDASAREVLTEVAIFCSMPAWGCSAICCK